MASSARVFLVTPFSHTSAGNEDPARYARVQQAVEEGAHLAGVTLVHPRAMQAAGNVLEQILRELDQADAVVAILTGYNPNILFEVGYAARRAPILIAPDAEQLPFDLRIYRVITYGNDAELAALPGQVAGAIRETLASAAQRSVPRLRAYLEAVDQRVRTSGQFLPPALRSTFAGDFAAQFVPIRLRTEGGGVPTSAHVEVSSLLRDAAPEQDPEDICLMGVGGAGKSTLLRYISLNAWTNPGFRISICRCSCRPARWRRRPRP